MLHINDLTYRIAGRTLLDQASVSIPRGHKVALVGRNGTGKSTLLRLIAGEIAPDGGEITMPANARVGWVRQEVPAGAKTLLETVLEADVERTALLAEAETATDPNRIAEIHLRLADIEAHSAEARAAQILSGLGFDAAAQARPCADFSGGWRMRVALAGVLFTAPDLLLLDEPTNHLDLEAAMWLEGYLKTYPSTILLVSHDRGLLNAVPTTTVHLDQGKLVGYSGGYDQFAKTRAAKLENLKAQAAKQEAQRAHMQSFIDRFRAKATKAKQAQSRMKALERMGPAITVIEDGTVSFDFPSPEELAPPLITLDNVSIGYDGKAVLRNLNMRIDPDDRIALLGANGNGKSTLVKLLAGRLAPLDGEMRRSNRIKVGYFAQHQAEELNLDWTPVRQMAAVLKDAPEQKVRAHLGRFGFPQQKADTRIGSLSGGEKARLLFALMSREAPAILLLDEPTNHLDIESREALVEAINGYQGAVILISHDPYLVELTADRLWLVADGGCRAYDGDLDEYRAWLVDQRRGEQRAAGAEAKAANKRDDRRTSAELRQQLAPLRRQVEAAEKKMATLEKRKATLEEKLADPALYQGPKDALTKAQIDLAQVQKDLTQAEDDWMTASEALEAARS